jgi:ATP-dependent helicase HepA
MLEQLAKHAAGLILLTATPEKLGKETPFAQLSLLDADRFYSFSMVLPKPTSSASITRSVSR